jgi:CxxC motif-containing protein (DUF1111 family)
MKRINIIGVVLTGLALALLGSGCKSQPPALGEPLAGLTRAQRAQFEAGRQVFTRVFDPTNGLGPLFNGTGCADCHENPVVGGVGDEIEVHATRFDPPSLCDPLFQEGGPVIQQHATPLLQAKGIQKEQIPPSATAQARRTTPPLFGFGLVDAIPDATLLAKQQANAAKNRSIRGHVNRSVDGRVGRFGRKAAVATLFEFNARAFLEEMGITTTLSPTEKPVNGTPLPPGTFVSALDPEIGNEDIEKVTAFVRFLAPPPPGILTNYQDQLVAARGRQLFHELQCNVCHVPTMRTRPSHIKALDRKTVALYSDLLVHDMGPDLADICLGQARPSEFRTEMLMGLRFRTQFLHDGRAQTVQEAIERHGGEALESQARFKALSDSDKQALLKFLSTL